MGRPLKFKTVEELQNKIDEYFNSCYDGKEQIRPYTMSGLALYLDCDRKTLLNYSENDEYFHTIKKARARCENFAEEQLFTNRNVTGVIFNLKNNYCWVDKQEFETNGKTTVNNMLDFSKLSTEDIKAMLNKA